MNIEKTISEHAVSDILIPMLESQDRIVTEDVAPLFDQATGLDTPPASGTVTTTIEESRSVITAIIRKAWTATLTMLCGASVISYIAAAYTYLRNRLQGNETYGIPDRRSEISASSPLAANLALLNDRKISGVPDAVDGISLVHLLNDTLGIETLTDDNEGWEASKSNWLGTLLGLFPNAKRIDVKCETITNSPVTTSYSNNETDIHIYAKTLSFTQANAYNYLPKCNVYLEEMETYSDSSNNMPVFQSKGIYFMKYKAGVWRVAGSAGWGNSQTQKIYCGCKGAKTDHLRFWAYDYNQDQAANLVDFEIAEGTCQSLTLQGLFHLTAENMYNHILCRLKQDEAGCGDGVTITLGTTNIEKLEAVEEYNTKLTELEDTYGYTFA